MNKKNKRKKKITHLAPSLKHVKKTIEKNDIQPDDEIKFQLTEGGPLHTLTLVDVFEIH